MNQNDMLQLKDTITIPDALTEKLVQGCAQPQKRHNHAHISKIAVSMIAVFALLLSGTTSFAYNIYQEYTLAVFWEKELSASDIDHLGQELADIDGISSCRYISGMRHGQSFPLPIWMPTPPLPLRRIPWRTPATTASV